MNPYQRIVLASGAFVVAVMCLFPPWLFVDQFPNRGRIERPVGYRPVWKAPETGRFTTMRINGTQLGIQIVGTAMMTLVGYLVVQHGGIRKTGRTCAACKSGDHSFHDDDSCTNPSSRDPKAGQCECIAKVPSTI